MKAIVIAVIAILAAAALAAPKWHQLTSKYSFEQYCADFGKSYNKATGEHNYRASLFAKKLETVLSHNADKSQSYKKGVNQFSDWTAEEWSSYNTYQAKPQKMTMLPINEWTGSGRAAFPKTVDHRRADPPVLSAVKNQGHCGSCWAHSAAESIESQFALLTTQVPVLSQQQISACTQIMYGCGGGNVLAAWDYVSGSDGLNEEWLYPYTDFFAQNMSKAATSKCLNITEKFLPNFAWLPKANVTSMYVVEPNKANVMQEALLTQGPISIAVGAGAWNDYEHGIYHNNASSNVDFQIDHAVQAVGYGYDEDLNQNYWIVRNSWGTTWGEDGFIRLYRPDADKEPCGLDQGQKVCGTSGILSSGAFPKVSMLKKLNP